MKIVSIHAARVGSDFNTISWTPLQGVFQSTLPVWAATPEYNALYVSNKFQSTLPVWAATTS